MLQVIHDNVRDIVNKLFDIPGTDLRLKKRIVVKKGTGYIVLHLSDVVLIHTENKMTYVVDREGKKYVGNGNLSEIEATLDKNYFFRANRQYILNIDFIRSYKSYEKVKLQVDMVIPDLPYFIVISQEVAPQFREWMNRA